jgi:hypothetical protein
VLLHPSRTQLIVDLVVACLSGWFGFWLSERDRRLLGRTPWGLRSVLWAMIWFLFPLLGVILYLIAHNASVRRAHQTQLPGLGVPGASVPMSAARKIPAKAPTASDLFPAYPRPANNRPATPGEAERPEAPVGPEPVVSPSGGAQAPTWPHSPPAWHPDPSGRFHYRWWDGHEWTSHVSTDGHHLIDTNPDQRIGPY